jgi:catabolite regulation protein CreA
VSGWRRGSWPVPQRLDRQQHCCRGGAGPEGAGGELPYQPVQPGLIHRLSKGNWFVDPSNSSIACRQTGPITVGDINTSASGEEVFSQRLSLIFKSLAVRRIYDKKDETLVYVIYSRQVKDASAKMSISTVPLYGVDVKWARDKQQ